LAMVNFANEVKETDFHAQLLLQVHDELIFEVPKEEVEAFEKFIEKIMDNLIVQLKRREVDIYAKCVYKNLERFNEEISVKNIIEDQNFEEVFIMKIVNCPESISKFAGRKILGLKTSKYKTAERNVEALVQKVHDYVHIVKEVENEIIEENLIKK
ncbi:MAG: BID domain-containing T4SS effector, partial [Bartonella sp.]|nr:BID domain-containing T4SS effector [Bartonella sp.]